MRRTITVVLLVLALVASACSDDGGDPVSEPEPGEPGSGEGGGEGEGGVSPARVDRTGPIRVRLAEGTGDAPVAAAITVAEGTPLDAASIVAVVDRLPEWIEDESDQVDFNRPAESIPPPRTGDTIDQPFPADGGDPPPEVEEGPLEVLRVQPEGEVGIAPFVSVTFNQPMVALGTVAQTDAADVPVSLTPEPPGRWIWIGTRTVRFEHDPDIFDRLPMATSYVVEIPAGTESASGNPLGEAVRVEFETPTPSVRWLNPQHDSLDLETMWVAEFDQNVDADAVLGVTTLTADGQEVALRLATDNEIEADEDASQRIEQLLDGRWMAFRAVEPLPRNAALELAIGPNVPSVEGPNTTDDVARFTMRTYAPLRIENQSCTATDPCQPEWGFGVQFNNQLDAAASPVDEIGIDPTIPGARIRVEWDSIFVEGDAKGSTVYTMTIPGDLTDMFGQTLGEDTEVEFHIDAAFPFLNLDEGDPLVTLDPLVESQTFPMIIRNHDQVRVRAYDVAPGDWEEFIGWWERQWDEQGLPAAPFTEVYDEVVDTGAPRDERFEARIDLEPVFGGDPGMAVVIVEPVGELADLTRNDDFWWQNRPVVAWVQSTNIGADIIASRATGVVWTTDLRTGEPLEGVEVFLGGTQGPLRTGDDGLVTTDLPIVQDGPPMYATLGDDTVMTWSNPTASLRTNPTISYVIDDRTIYRPGDTMRVKGWIRRLELTGDAELVFFPEGEVVTYRFRDSFGNELATGELELDDRGGIDFEVDIPAGANLGQGWIEFRRPGPLGDQWNHQVRIEEFRRPEFEVTARAETDGPYLVDRPATVAVDATYFSGGPLPDAPVNWTVTTTPSQYSPPGWDDFIFGQWIPWWFFGSFERGFGFDGFGGGFERETSRESFTGTTDSNGTHFLEMTFEGDPEGRPTTVNASANVTDVNRQTWGSATDLLVHPGELYVGLRATRTFVREGEPLDVEVIVAGIDGDAVPGRSLTVVAERVVNDYVDGEWTEVYLDREEFEITSSQDPETVTFGVPHGGQWRISAGVVDDAGRESRTEMQRWVTGGDAVPSRRLELQEATIVPDAQDYAPGDTAELLIASPFGAAHGLMSVTRNGFVSVEPFEIPEGESDIVLEVPITEDLVPNVQVDIELVGTADRSADDGTVLPDVAPRPAFATGSIGLRVPPVSRTLTVEANPAADVVEPGADTSVTVEVTDADGAPVADADLLVVAVDEALLALSGFELMDPLEVFYRGVDSGVFTDRSRRTIRLADPEDLIAFEQALRDEVTVATTTTVPGERFREVDAAIDGFGEQATADEGGDGGGSAFAPSPTGLTSARNAVTGGQESPDTPIDVRTDFDAVALWAPGTRTGADGTATLDIDVPDNLTRYRVMVVAVDGADRFGSTESNLTARLPLQVRPSAPRFLNFGDDFELPIVVQNLTDAAVDVDVVLQSSNLEIVGSAGRAVTVPANDRVEVRFPARTDSAGTARFRAAVASAGHTDAATVSLPVYTPATAEAFATYGVVDAGSIIQPVLAPTGVIPQFGGLEVQTSSTALQALTDAVLYLAEYPYRSSDAYASRILAISALRDVLEAFQAEGLPSAAELDATVANDIRELAALQNFDGGFGSWYRDQRSSPYRSVQAMHALFEAVANGYTVPQETLQRGRDYLRNIDNHIPSTWSQLSRDTLIAYSLYARRIDGDVDSARARQVWNRSGNDLALDAIAWLWPVVEDAGIEAEIGRTFNNRVTETPSAATFTTNYGEDAYLLLHSDRRTDGIVLDAFIEMAPDSDLIPKIVAGLIGNQRQGRWNNVQENSFILLALNNYFDTFEATTPDFVARVWLGDLYAAEHEFEGREIDRNQTIVPTQELIDQGDADLVLAKDGDGRLYYRLGLRYAPADFDLDPLDRGFVVQRTYEAVDDDGDVWRDDDGTWHVRAGAEVRVRLTMVNDSRRVNMALVDPLPAGLEPLNPALANTGDIPPDPIFEEEFGFDGPDVVFSDVGDGFVSFGRSADLWWYGNWWDHQNLRDDRVEAFSEWLWAGTHNYSYVARATTPGTFVVPPTRAEEIYSPEVFGRSGSDLVIVEP